MPASSQTAPRLRQAPRDLALRSWPLAEGHPAAWATLVLAAVLFFAATVMTASPATGMTLAALLLLSQWRYFVPVRFETGAGGIQRTVFGRTRRVAWSAVGRVERRRHGLLVQRDSERSALAAFNGLFIPYGAHEAELMAVFDFYLAGRAEPAA